MDSNLFEVRASDAALEDLDEAVSYRLRIEGPKSALRLLDALDAAIDRLSEVPEVAVKIGSSGYHWLSVENYVFVYSIDMDTSSVRVHRLHYETSNWRSRILSQE